MDPHRAHRRTAGITKATSRVAMVGPVGAGTEGMEATRRSPDTTRARRSSSGTRAEARGIILGICSRALARDIMAGSSRISPAEVRLSSYVDSLDIEADAVLACICRFLRRVVFTAAAAGNLPAGTGRGPGEIRIRGARRDGARCWCVFDSHSVVVCGADWIESN